MATEVSLRGEEDLGVLNSLLHRLARAAYRLDRRDEARAAAERCLAAYHRLVGRPFAQSVRPGVYQNAHTILGLLALDAGDHEGARRSLMASVDLPDAETNDVEYVALDLARRLLAAGDRELVASCVAKLLKRCSRCDAPAVEAFLRGVIREDRKPPLTATVEPGLARRDCSRAKA